MRVHQGQGGSHLLPFARSRRKPVTKEAPPFPRAWLFWQEHIGWRVGQAGRAAGRFDEMHDRIASAWDELKRLDVARLAERIAAPACHASRLLIPDEAGLDIALALEVMRRETGLSLRRNQIECALWLLAGTCTELRTGEGKTLAAGLAAVVAARCGVSVHVATVNDYLASRDHALIAPVARHLGLSSAVVLLKDEDPAKQAAYDSDILYATNKTLVFDALRDRREKRLGRDPATARQMGQAFAIMDEADSVLIDDATVPMILSEPFADPPEADVTLFQDLLGFAQGTERGRDRSKDAQGNWRLTARGIDRLARAATAWTHPSARDDGLIGLAETALSAVHSFRKGVAYLVREGEIVMIDQATGRLMDDRKWGYGMQQMIELKEGLDPSPENRTVGQITQQTYFRQYRHLAGLTGTARECRGELWAIYGLGVVPVAPHAQSRMKDMGFTVFSRADEKWRAVAAEATRIAQTRAVLIGINDVAESEALQQVFAAEGRDVAVLDALTESREADLVAEAGQPGRITIATHLAGRGTDIALHEDVRAAGGLHVIIASVMASGRLERQLYGRAGRQGDPGSFSRRISLEDRGLTEGAKGLARFALLTMLRLRLVPRRALAGLQTLRDAQARGLRRKTLLREQELARHLGYR
ncbi:preprotein translocase subunit SecA [Roseovarius aquimarinus]